MKLNEGQAVTGARELAKISNDSLWKQCSVNSGISAGNTGHRPGILFYFLIKPSFHYPRENRASVQSTNRVKIGEDRIWESMFESDTLASDFFFFSDYFSRIKSIHPNTTARPRSWLLQRQIRKPKSLMTRASPMMHLSFPRGFLHFMTSQQEIARKGCFHLLLFFMPERVALIRS